MPTLKPQDDAQPCTQGPPPPSALLEYLCRTPTLGGPAPCLAHGCGRHRLRRRVCGVNPFGEPPFFPRSLRRGRTCPEPAEQVPTRTASRPSSPAMQPTHALTAMQALLAFSSPAPTRPNTPASHNRIAPTAIPAPPRAMQSAPARRALLRPPPSSRCLKPGSIGTHKAEPPAFPASQSTRTCVPTQPRLATPHSPTHVPRVRPPLPPTAPSITFRTHFYNVLSGNTAPRHPRPQRPLPRRPHRQRRIPDHPAPHHHPGACPRPPRHRSPPQPRLLTARSMIRRTQFINESIARSACHRLHPPPPLARPLSAHYRRPALPAPSSLPTSPIPAARSNPSPPPTAPSNTLRTHYLPVPHPQPLNPLTTPRAAATEPLPSPPPPA